jgi:hypothetical protein
MAKNLSAIPANQFLSGMTNKKAVYANEEGYIPAVGTLPLAYRGSPGTSWTAREYGDNTERKTVLTLGSDVTFPAVSGAGNLQIGLLTYTFPAVNVAVGNGAVFVGSMQAASGTGATPEVGLGMALGSGASATLGATHKNVAGATSSPTMTDLNSTSVTVGDSVAIFGSAASAPKLYINLAANWAGADTITLKSGSQIIFNWKPLDQLEQTGYKN